MLLISGLIGFSQSDVFRSNGLNRLIDPRLAATKTFNPPSFIDTTAANLVKGTDSCGALIFTYDVNNYWVRKCNPKKWVQITSAGNTLSSVSIVNDTTLQFCYSDGNCVNININNTVNNITTFEFTSDTTMVVCNVDNVCDTVAVPRQQQPKYSFNNGLTQISPYGVEWGGFLLHNTTMNGYKSRIFFYGSPENDYGWQFIKQQNVLHGGGLLSLLHYGGTNGDIDSVNDVRLSINYTTDSMALGARTFTGMMGNKIGYIINVNGNAEDTTGFFADNISSKFGGIMIHTLDTTNTDAITFFGTTPPNRAIINRLTLGETLESYRILTLHNNKQVQAFGYGSSSTLNSSDTTANKPAAFDANGNLVRMDAWVGSGGTSALNSGDIFVGNSSNIATDRTPTLSANQGTFALTNTGVFTYPYWRNGLDVVPSGIAKFGASNNRSINFYTNNSRAMQIDSFGIVRIDTGIVFRPISTSISFFNPPPAPSTLPYISFGSTITRAEPKNISWMYHALGIRFRDLANSDMKVVMNSVHGIGYIDGDGTEEMFDYMPYGGEKHWYTMRHTTDTLASDMGFISNLYDWQLLRNITIRYNAALSQSDTMGINIGNAFTGSHQPDPGTLQMGLRLSFLAIANRARINAGVDSVGYGTLGNKYALELQDEGGQLFVGTGKIDGYIPDDSAKVQINGNLVIAPKVTGFPYGYLAMHLGQSGSGSDVFPDIGFNNVHTTVAQRWKYATAKASSLIYFPNGGFVFKGTNVAGTGTISYNDFMTISNTGTITTPYLPNGGAATDSVMVIDASGNQKKRNASAFGSITAGWGLTGTSTFKVDTTLVASLFALNDTARVLRSLIGGGGTASLTATYVGYGDGSNLLTGTNTLTYNNSTTTFKIGATTNASLGILRINSTDGEGKISFVYGAGNTEYGYMKINTGSGTFGFGSAFYPLDFFSGGTFRFWDNNLNLYRSVAAGTGDIRLNVGYGSTAYAYVDANTGTGVSTFGSDNYPVKLYSEGNNVITFAGANTKIIGKTFAGGTTTPTALIHLAAGTATANTSPLKFTTASAALLTSAEAGAMEVLADSLYYTGSSALRRRIQTAITAYNGLTKVGTDSLKLGGTLTENTTIATGANKLTISTSTAATNPLSIASTTGHGITISTSDGDIINASSSGSGTGLNITTTSGSGASIQSSTNTAANFFIQPSSTNTAATILKVVRLSSGTAANGIGGSIDFMNQTTSGTFLTANKLISKWTDATDATITSQFIFTGENSGVAGDILTLNGNKSLQLNGYGVNTFAGTPTYLLGVDGSGNVVETPTGTTGTYTPTATMVTNVTGYTVNNGTYWYRVGNTITVSGEVQIDPTTTGATELDITIPIASALVNAYDLNGTGVSPVETAEPASFEADATNDRVAIKFVATSTANRTYHFVFTYLVK